MAKTKSTKVLIVFAGALAAWAVFSTFKIISAANAITRMTETWEAAQSLTENAPTAAIQARAVELSDQAASLVWNAERLHGLAIRDAIIGAGMIMVIGAVAFVLVRLRQRREAA